MFLPTRRREVRQAAINASTVFAITLAIIAGLIFAYVFKVVLLDRKPKPAVAAEKVYTLTVATRNLTDQEVIQATDVRTVNVTKEKYDEWMAKKPEHGGSDSMLTGNQPIGRITKEFIKADTPIFEDQVVPHRYPRPVSESLAPGKVAAVVPLKPYEAMIQVNDRVDVIATISSDNELFGIGSTASAVVARNVKVVARFNTTSPASRPRPGAATWDYTVEVTPYRYKLIEMCKRVQAAFSLQVVQRPKEGEAGSISVAAGSPDDNDDKDRDKDVLTSGDLARLFNITPAEADRIWEIQRFSGLKQRESWYYNMPKPAAPAPQPGSISPAGGPSKPTGLPSGRVNGNGNSVTSAGWSRLNGGAAPAAPAPARSPVNSGTLVASAGRTAGLSSSGNNFGFRAPGPKAKC